MPARTGREYLEGLRRQEREVWLGGERVEDVTEVLREFRPRRTSTTYVRGVLRDLTAGYSPAPTAAVRGSRGRTLYRLHPRELGQWDKPVGE